ncbi:MAG: malto-oligosyltrehalose trehalohydrolase [Pseudomonadota bacterium]|nr:malto-oligosyltrehalose trehalohydrolase [Pseudomonadota bacterium]
MEIGAIYQGNGQCEFIVWGPLLKQVTLQLLTPKAKQLSMTQDQQGYWRLQATDIQLGSQYYYQLNRDILRPDPASRLQRQGVHQASTVVDYRAYAHDRVSSWTYRPLEEYIIYELHVGTFSQTGDFDAIIAQLPYLSALGITAIELMPVAQFSGQRNWGYDGVLPYAVQADYGGPAGLKRLVNACHQHGLAVILDVVYNHLGPEGNYLGDYGPYFSNKYVTLWGEALNFDGPYCDPVRDYFIENALYWLRYFDIDALRLDAIDAIYDQSVTHFLHALQTRVEHLSQQQGRPYFLIAESDLNDTRIIKPQNQCGYGLQAQWCADFQRTLHTLLTAERDGVYADFGELSDFVRAYEQGFANTGYYSPFRKRQHGMSSKEIPAHQLIVYNQTHDLIGNRALGERLNQLVSESAHYLMAGIVLLSPYIPLLFMGEEYAETNHFYYFIDHSDPDLIEAIKQGRKTEFQDFNWAVEPLDPKAETTFLASKLKGAAQPQQQLLFQYYKKLIDLRTTIPALKQVTKVDLSCEVLNTQLVSVQRRYQNSTVWMLLNFKQPTPVNVALNGRWQKRLDSAAWLGNSPTLTREVADEFNDHIAAESLLVFERIE